MEHTVPYKDANFRLTSKAINNLLHNSDSQMHAAEIQDSDYHPINIDEIAQSQTHLKKEQRDDLAALLHKFPKLFDGKLRRYPHRKIHLELEPGT